MNMMNMQHMNNSFHHNSSQISETTYSMKAENQMIGAKKKNSSTFKHMAHSPSPSQTFFKDSSKKGKKGLPPFVNVNQKSKIYVSWVEVVTADSAQIRISNRQVQLYNHGGHVSMRSLTRTLMLTTALLMYRKSRSKPRTCKYESSSGGLKTTTRIWVCNGDHKRL